MEDGNEDQRMLTASDSVEPSVSSAADEVKKYSVQQREALPGEPRCIECGRYGEYICDETDDDICSLECKQKLLLRTKQPKPPTSLMLPPVRLPATDECFYVRDGNGKSEGRSLTTDQTELIRVKFEIVVKGNCVPAPVLSFAHCNLPQKLLQNIESAGYEILTPVQMQAIPAALSRQSLLVSAETGSGKTASYLVPTVSYCANFRKESSVDQKKPLVMVLTPTRELCIQVEEQAKVLGKGLPFKTALVVGGDAMPRQIHRIQGGIEMIIGTPGRLIDLLTKFEIELDSVSILVIDEVDCMLQRGFREQVMQIYRALSQPQVLLYSATVPIEVEKMASSLAKEINIITVGKLNKPNQAVKQVAIWVESKHKKQKLFDIFNSRQHFKPPVIVFVGSRLGADLLSDAITIYTGLKTSAIHGEKSMKERRGILSSFLLGELPVIVATGILGRGIDLLHVRQVIVFDMPNSVKEYVHQIGRASRMGEEGNSILFVNEENKKLFPELIGILRSSGAAIPREITNSRYLAASLPSDRGNRKRKPYV
ncbi:DEAD-box ATP-dependent RNA helicase 41 [Cynara cardunculus var. scolymus]|uniref:DEAD-box ATP-dependent RNA helicase 41 n=1 Tax=Cynara cardunculus var. scolymus TaxID=59895 RepID=UPI000D624129|nr:DEAD-box ATP-dependent RNA helicase 41 [Cynara cardunculus var. scolymus]